MEYLSSVGAILLIVLVNALLVNCYLEKEDVIISDVETSSPVNDYAWTYEDDEWVTPRQARTHPAYRHRLSNRRAFPGVKEEDEERVPNDEQSLESIKEPTCEELKSIWKLSKQAAMQSLANNEIPTYAPGTFGHIVQNPGSTAYGRVVMQQPAKSSSGTKYVHGRKIYHPDDKSKSGDSLRRRTAGSYEKLEEQLRNGFFNRLNNKNRRLHRGQEDEKPIVYGTYKNNEGLTELASGGKHLHKSHNKNVDRNSRREMMGETDKELSQTENTGCKKLVSRKCHSSNACSCFYGFRTCLSGKCKKLKSKNQVGDIITHTLKIGDDTTDPDSIPRNAYQNIY